MGAIKDLYASLEGDFPPLCMPVLKPQEIPFDHPDSSYRFTPSPEKPFVATPAAIETYRDAIYRCLTQLQDLAATKDGRWVKITDAAMHEQPRGFAGFKVSPAAFLIDGIQNNRMPPDWMYAHEKKQEREQWDRDKAAFVPTEPAPREDYDRERAKAFEEFRRSAEGSAIYDKTFPILLAFHKVTDPLCHYAAARQATLARLERENFPFPEFDVWTLERQRSNSAQAA